MRNCRSFGIAVRKKTRLLTDRNVIELDYVYFEPEVLEDWLIMFQSYFSYTGGNKTDIVSLALRNEMKYYLSTQLPQQMWLWRKIFDQGVTLYVTIIEDGTANTLNEKLLLNRVEQTEWIEFI